MNEQEIRARRETCLDCGGRLEGKVLAFMCQECCRIAHYGAVAEPKK